MGQTTVKPYKNYDHNNINQHWPWCGNEKNMLQPVYPIFLDKQGGRSREQIHDNNYGQRKTRINNEGKI